MHDYHSLLKRQLHRILDGRPVPPDWETLLEQVDASYRQLDRDRAMIERSMEISSQELLQANADIRTVLEGLIDYYIRLDGKGRILYARGLNVPAIFTPQAVVSGVDIGDAVIPELKPLVTDILTRMQIEPVLSITECTTGSGTNARHYELRCIPAHNRQTSLIIRDITAAKMAALREQKLQQRLARAERIESLGILAGGVAHDLNNILSPLVSYPDLLIEYFSELDPRRKMLEQMQNSVSRATAIIKDLLTLTRRGNHQTEPVDVNRVISQYLHSVEFRELSLRHPNITIDLRAEPDLPMLTGSQHQLSQTVMNLITNAFEAIGTRLEGRVTIETRIVDAPGGADTLDTDIMEPHLLLEVADTGAGIPENELDHIFEPFFSRRKHGRSGTGLGLAIVYGTVKDFGGTIKVTSRVGEGARFSIRLPIHPARAGAPVIPQEQEEPARACTVLVIDDDPNQRELCRVLLGSRGYTVHVAPDGRAGVAYLKEHDVDIVLLDMIMEDDFDGLETYKAIHAFKPAQKCVIVSGYAQTDNVQSALALGVHSFVQKPYTLKTIIGAIQAALKAESMPASGGA